VRVGRSRKKSLAARGADPLLSRRRARAGMAVATGRARYLRVAGSARQGRELVRGACGRPYSAERPQDEQSRRARASSARRAARTGHRAAPAQAKKWQRLLTAPDVHWRQRSTPSARTSGNATQRLSSAKRALSTLAIGERKMQWPRATPDVHWRQRRRTVPRARHQRPRRETLASTSYSNCRVHQRELVCPGSLKF